MSHLNTKTINDGVTASKVLSSETRFKILNILSEHKNEDICVKEIADEIGLSHSATSHQLAKLQDMGIVSPSRMGQTMCYSLTDSPLSRALTQIIKHLSK